MPHIKNPDRRLPYHRKGFHQQVVEGFSRSQPFFELIGLLPKLFITEAFIRPSSASIASTVLFSLLISLSLVFPRIFDKKFAISNTSSLIQSKFYHEIKQ